MFQNTTVNEPKLKQICIECGGSNLVERFEVQRFAYGAPGDQAILTAAMPAITCEDCGNSYFDERGEMARHVAVCRHLGVQTPEEIRNIRIEAKLSRDEFCRLTGFGPASLQRWETGAIVPNASSDTLMFLLRYADNIGRLRQRSSVISQGHLPYVAGGVDPLMSVKTAVPEARTKCATKRFGRIGVQTRIPSQAANWSLRRA